jgi:replication factor A1
VDYVVLFTIRDLEDKSGGVDIRLRVVEKKTPRTVKTKNGEDHSVADVIVGDRTGTVILSLWDEKIDEVSVGDVIDVENGYVSRFKGRLRLNIGKFGRIETVKDSTFPSLEMLCRQATRFYYRRRSTTKKES